MTIPSEVIKHCEKFKFCKGCPIRTCVAPESESKYQEWLENKIVEIQQVMSKN